MTEHKGNAWSRFASAVPALVLAELVLVAGALLNGLQAGSWDGEQKWAITSIALLQAGWMLLRLLPLLLLLSLPILALDRRGMRVVLLGLLWSLVLVLQAMLDQYYQVAHVPLGADLFGYSAAEIRTTLADGAPVSPRSLFALVLPLVVLWLGLLLWHRRNRRGSTLATVLLLIAAGLAWLFPLPTGAKLLQDDAARDLACNKLVWFGGDVWRWQRGDAAAGSPQLTAAAGQLPPLDPKFPFLRPEQTPDALGEYFSPTHDGSKPNVVVIVVEGLGRSFSGPQASLGSFTPFLDELATRSLYFDNFLSNQGRTFGVLPSLFGSAPFADQGFTALGASMPAHPGLFTVLGQQGYHTAFYNGTDTAFDDEKGYMQLQQVQRLVDMNSFGPGYQRNPFSAWGYPDKELVSRVLADTGQMQAPFLTAIQTISMHTSYEFPGQDEYRTRMEQRLQTLGIPAAELPAYRANAAMYSTILYTDDQLRRYFESVATAPWYANTIFVVTGDHRLPEIPMGEHVDRYHVPLIIFSPLLKQPRRVRAVSSQLDVTPSLMALLSNTYGLKRPARTPWLGTGLDMADQFRNTHALPLQQTKTSGPEYLAERWWLRDGKLYELQDGMHLAETDDEAVRDWVAARKQRYEQANAIFMQQHALTPDGATPALVAYQAPSQPEALAVVAPSAHGVAMDAAQAVRTAQGVQLTAVFRNGDAIPSKAFVPLAVLATEDGRELKEVYGTSLQLPAGGHQQVQLALPYPADCQERCFVSVFPSDPETGKAMGAGRYHLPVDAGTASGSSP